MASFSSSRTKTAAAPLRGRTVCGRSPPVTAWPDRVSALSTSDPLVCSSHRNQPGWWPSLPGGTPPRRARKPSGLALGSSAHAAPTSTAGEVARRAGQGELRPARAVRDQGHMRQAARDDGQPLLRRDNLRGADDPSRLHPRLARQPHERGIRQWHAHTSH